MMAGALPPVAAAALARGRARGSPGSGCGSSSPSSRCSRSPPPDVDEALASLGEAALEWKLDGARVQVHKDGERGARVLAHAPRRDGGGARGRGGGPAHCPRRRSCSTARPSRSAPDGAPEPFQVTMRRFGRKLDVARLARGAAALGPASSTRSTRAARTSSHDPRASATPRSPPPSRTRCASRGSSRRPRRRGRVPRRRARARPRGAPREVARRALRGGAARGGLAQGEARAHARPRRARRRSGAAGGARASSRTSTSARAIPTPAGSSCSGRRSRG